MKISLVPSPGSIAVRYCAAPIEIALANARHGHPAPMNNDGEMIVVFVSPGDHQSSMVDSQPGTLQERLDWVANHTAEIQRQIRHDLIRPICLN